MTKYYVMYWNDHEDYPVAVFETEAEDELEAENKALKAGGFVYEDNWPLLVETDLTPETVKRYKNSVWTDYKEVK